MCRTSSSVFLFAALVARLYAFRLLSTFTGNVLSRTGDMTPWLPGDTALGRAGGTAVETLSALPPVVLAVGAVLAPAGLRLVGEVGILVKGNFVPGLVEARGLPPLLVGLPGTPRVARNILEGFRGNATAELEFRGEQPQLYRSSFLLPCWVRLTKPSTK